MALKTVGVWVTRTDREFVTYHLKIHEN